MPKRPGRNEGRRGFGAFDEQSNAEDPQLLAEIAVAQTVSDFEDILNELEVPKREQSGILRRLGRKATDNIPTKIDTKWILGQLDAKIALTLANLDEFALSRANARDLSGLLAVLVDRRQLLKGEPTAIISAEDRRSLNELVPIIVAEAKRRGMAPADIMLSAEDYEVLGHSEPMAKPKRALVKRG